MSLSEHIRDVDESTFEAEVLLRSHDLPVVVDFWAPWCEPCRVLGPLLERLAIEAGGAFRLAKVNVDDNPKLAVRYGVQGIPAIKGFRHGEVVSELVGNQPEPIVRRFLQRLAPSQFDRGLEEARSGARVSLAVGFVSVGIAATIGVLLGAAAGFHRGAIDGVIMRLVDLMLVFPRFFLLLAVLAFLRPSIWTIMVVIGLTGWMGVARLVRAEFLSLQEREFVIWSHAVGASAPGSSSATSCRTPWGPSWWP